MLGMALGERDTPTTPPPRRGGHVSATSHAQVCSLARDGGHGEICSSGEICLSACFNLVNNAFVLLLP